MDLWLGGAQVLPHPSRRHPQVPAQVIWTMPSSLPSHREILCESTGGQSPRARWVSSHLLCGPRRTILGIKPGN